MEVLSLSDVKSDIPIPNAMSFLFNWILVAYVLNGLLSFYLYFAAFFWVYLVFIVVSICKGELKILKVCVETD